MTFEKTVLALLSLILVKLGGTHEEAEAALRECETQTCDHIWSTHTHGHVDGTTDAVCSKCGWCPNQQCFFTKVTR